MGTIRELDYKELTNWADRQILGFETTADISPGECIIGQERAEKALAFGLGIKSKGYNVYVCGLPGTGKTTFSKRFALAQAENEPVPEDLCYVYNFKNPKEPVMMLVAAGTGKTLKADMEELVERLCEELPKAFAAKDFESRKSDIVKTYQAKRDDIIKDMTEEAKEHNFGVKTTNSGIYFMPIVDGAAISEEQFEKLPEEQKDGLSKDSEAIQRQAQQVMREIKEYEKETRRNVEDLEYSVGLFAVGRIMTPLLDKYKDVPNVMKYLQNVKEDILNNLDDFLEQDDGDDESIQSILPWMQRRDQGDAFFKYYVNLLTDHSGETGAPVIVDYNPTYANLIGEVEYDNEYGNLTTDFMKIKPGLLHKANGGYLILQAHDVFSNLHSWETIRRALLTREITIEPLREFATGLAVSGIKPEPVPLNVKVIMVGTGYYYDVLYNFDDEFQKLFAISADFDYEMPNSRENAASIASFVKKIIGKEGLLEFDVEAVMEVLRYAGRLAESQKRLSTRFNRLAELLIEASAWAKAEKGELVRKTHVARAIAERDERYKLYEDKLSQMLMDNQILIDTKGVKVGQINGLAVLDTGEYAFAMPLRITATTYMGKAGIVNIEQEAEMSGSIHDKGVQVLTGYLGQTYAQEFPLSLSCRVCFEQSYSGVDGDSASSTELYAILSSLSGLPLSQELAVTGSINQRGEIQPIGGVTTKIEGFFDLCKSRGLTGGQGVIIPIQNVPDLMLNDEVIEAVAAGQFHIYPVSHIDEGMELLSGVPAGSLNAKGKYPDDSVNGKVQKRLRNMYKKSMAE